jgi:16S rRNA G966 N2-methylase RsmD
VGASGAIIRAGLAEAGTRLGGQIFDLIILDPPYADTAAADALGAAQALAGEGTRVVVEHATRHTPPGEHAGLRLTRTVKAGDSALSFYER